MRRTHRDLPDDFVARAFRVREAQLRGLTPRQLRGADLSAPFQGIRVVGAPHTIEEYCHAFLPRMRDHVAFSEATAARLLGLPVPWRLDRAQGLDLLVPSGRYCPQGRGIRPRRIRADLWAVTDVRGLPVTPAPLTLALLAKKCEIVELVVLADAIVTSADNYPGRSGTALATIDDLRAFAESAGAIPGSARLRTALDRVRTGVESPRESQLRCILVDAGFPEPEINVDIHDGGRFLGRGDLVYRLARVIFEYEGEGHRDERTHDRDALRARELAAAGWTVIQVTKADLHPSRHERLFAVARRALATAA